MNKDNQIGATDFEYSICNDGIILSKYTGSNTFVTVPENVSMIGDCAFLGCHSIISVNFPSILTQIGDCAFLECDSLTSVTIPAKVNRIGRAAFGGCKSLCFFNVDKSNECFLSENGIVFSKDMTSLLMFPIGCGYCSYTIPESVNTIEDYAFAMCPSLKNIIINSNVHCIASAAFAHCDNLESVYLGSEDISIAQDAFCDCPKLTVYCDTETPLAAQLKENGIDCQPLLSYKSVDSSNSTQENNLPIEQSEEKDNLQETERFTFSEANNQVEYSTLDAKSDIQPQIEDDSFLNNTAVISHKSNIIWLMFAFLGLLLFVIVLLLFHDSFFSMIVQKAKNGFANEVWWLFLKGGRLIYDNRCIY